MLKTFEKADEEQAGIVRKHITIPIRWQNDWDTNQFRQPVAGYNQLLDNLWVTDDGDGWQFFIEVVQNRVRRVPFHEAYIRLTGALRITYQPPIAPDLWWQYHRTANLIPYFELVEDAYND